jgi:hypothetical protein
VYYKFIPARITLALIIVITIVFPEEILNFKLGPLAIIFALLSINLESTRDTRLIVAKYIGHISYILYFTAYSIVLMASYGNIDYKSIDSYSFTIFLYYPAILMFYFGHKITKTRSKKSFENILIFWGVIIFIASLYYAHVPNSLYYDAYWGLISI